LQLHGIARKLKVAQSRSTARRTVSRERDVKRAPATAPSARAREGERSGKQGGASSNKEGPQAKGKIRTNEKREKQRRLVNKNA